MKCLHRKVYFANFEQKSFFIWKQWWCGTVCFATLNEVQYLSKPLHAHIFSTALNFRLFRFVLVWIYIARGIKSLRHKIYWDFKKNWFHINFQLVISYSCVLYYVSLQCWRMKKHQFENIVMQYELHMQKVECST